MKKFCGGLCVLILGMFTVGQVPCSASGVEVIPSGCFGMGDFFSEAWPHELPIHEVCLSSFLMDTHEVTNAEYAECVDDGACSAPSDFSSNTRPSYYDNPTYDIYPVIHVSQVDANNYCAWAGKRLPTEAEWEYAARGGLADKRYPWGDTISCDDANWYGCVGDTRSVGSYPANDYGMYDISGNVFEWVNDWFDAGYYQDCYDGIFSYCSCPGGLPPCTCTDPLGPANRTNRSYRGGSWVSDYMNMRISNRHFNLPTFTNFNGGIRCAKDCALEGPEDDSSCSNGIDDDCDGLIDDDDLDCALICPDNDEDGLCDGADNCPVTANPLQADTDSDGSGDICDICPADLDDRCNPDGSTAKEIPADEGGTLETPDEALTIDIDPGDLGEDTTISVTETTAHQDPEVDLTVGLSPGRGNAIALYDLEPDAMVFDSLVTVTITKDVSSLNQNQRDRLGLYIYSDTDGDTYPDSFLVVPICDCTWVEDPPGTIIATCIAEVEHFCTLAMIAPLDTDDDGVADLFPPEEDNCPTTANPDQTDSDGDGIGDACESQYSAVANAEASAYGGRSLTASGSFNALALLLIPVGGIMFLRVLCRRK